MPEGIKAFEKVKSFWNDLEKGQKVRIFIMAGIGGGCCFNSGTYIES